jgi:HNH endonuclease
MVEHLPIVNDERTILVDDSTYPVLCRLRWRIDPRSGKGRPYTILPKEDREPGGSWCLYLARLITRAKPKVHMVQHINGNVLDCRMSNLRLLSANSPDRGQAGQPMNPVRQSLLPDWKLLALP